MGNKTWASDRERQVLLENLPRYEEASAKKKTPKFFEDIYCLFSKEFPIQSDVPNVDPEAIRALQKRRIRNWYNNHSGPRNQKHRAQPYRRNIAQTIRSLLCGVGSGTSRPKQKLQPIQAYSALYWQSKLKPIVDTEWTAKLATEPELKTTSGAYLKYMNMRLGQLLQVESAEVKAEVERYRNRKDVRAPVVAPLLLPHEESLPKEDLERLTKAKRRQRVNENLSPTLEEIAKTIEEETGAPIIIVAGSTAPSEGGTLHWSQVAAGETLDDGMNFFDFYQKFDTNVFGPFRKFAKKCIDFDEVRRLDLRPKKDQLPAVPDTDSNHDANPSASSSTANAPGDVLDGQSDEADDHPHTVTARFRAPTKTPSDMEREFDNLTPFESFEVDNDLYLAPHSPGPSPPFPSSLNPTTSVADKVRLSSGALISRLEYDNLLNLAPNKQMLRQAGLLNAAEASQESQRRSTQQFARVRTMPATFDSHPNVTSEMDVDSMTLDDAPPGLLPSPVVVGRGVCSSSAVVEPFVDFQAPASFASGAQPMDVNLNFDQFEPMDTDDDMAPNSSQPLSSFVTGPAFYVPPTVAAPTAVSVPQTIAAPVSPAVPNSMSAQPHAVVAPAAAAPAVTVPLVAAAAPSPNVPSQVAAPPVTQAAEVDTDAPPRRRHAGHISAASRAPRRKDVAASPATTSVRNALSDVTAAHSAMANASYKAFLDDLNVRTLPAWLEPHFVVLRGTFRGETEDTILVNWLTLECEDEHRGSAAKLRAAARPKDLSSWVRRPFPINPAPASLDAHQFGESLRKWWISLMPKWRAPADRDWPLLRDIPSGEKWTEVRKVGNAGVFAVLLGLSWWVSGCGERSEKMLYKSVLEDVAWVLENVVKDMVAFPKRVRAERAVEVEEEAVQTVRKSSRSSRPSKRALGL